MLQTHRLPRLAQTCTSLGHNEAISIYIALSSCNGAQQILACQERLQVGGLYVATGAQSCGGREQDSQSNYLLHHCVSTMMNLCTRAALHPVLHHVELAHALLFPPAQRHPTSSRPCWSATTAGCVRTSSKLQLACPPDAMPGSCWQAMTTACWGRCAASWMGRPSTLAAYSAWEVMTCCRSPSEGAAGAPGVHRGCQQQSTHKLQFTREGALLLGALLPFKITRTFSGSNTVPKVYCRSLLVTLAVTPAL